MTDNRIEYLQNQVQIVKDFLKSHNINISFFVAGGSVFSILNNKSTDGLDIDCYCYNQEDVDKLKTIQLHDNYKMFETNKALTFTTPTRLDLFSSACIEPENCLNRFNKLSDECSSRPIQFIIMKTGNPDDVFKTFDFNCSKCAYTSDNKLVTAKDFSKYISCDLDNFSSDILRRYIKYIEYKDAVDIDNKTAFELIDYCVEHKDLIAKPKYKEENPRTCLQILQSFMYHYFNRKNETHFKYIHDKIIEYYDEYTQFEIFKELHQVFLTYDGLCCDELNVHYLISFYSGISREIEYETEARGEKISQSDKTRILSKYPEYFI